MKNYLFTFIYKTCCIFLTLMLTTGCQHLESILQEKESARALKFSDIDYSRMIPLKTGGPQARQFEMHLTGGAIKSNTTCKLHFDTGSTATSIFYRNIDKSKIKVIRKDTKNNWGDKADLVSGTICTKSMDGQVEYCIEDFEFYAIESGRDIMGAFPHLRYGKPSFAYALSEKYSAGNEGYGIFTKRTGDDIHKHWNTTECYLQIGPYQSIEDKLNWRSDIPHLDGGTTYSPDAVPGFSVEIKVASTDKVIKTNGLMCTIDTGAPLLTMRLNASDSHKSSSFENHFVKKGPWEPWGNGAYNTHAYSLTNGLVTVDFQDDNGKVSSYSYTVKGNPYPEAPTVLIAADWNSHVPWSSERKDTPKHRINLGNTIYFYCPVYYYDIKNERVGIGFEYNSNEVASSKLSMDHSNMFKGDKLSGDKKIISKNGRYECYVNQSGDLVVEHTVNEENTSSNFRPKDPIKTIAQGEPNQDNYLILQESDGNLCYYTGENRFLWCAPNVVGSLRLELTDSGKLTVYDSWGREKWVSN